MFYKKKEEVSQEGLTTLLGKGSFFTGKLKADGGLRIDGEFEGTIDTSGTLVVGKEGVVKAEVKAKDVVVGGRFIGNINASRKVEFQSGAFFQGDVRCKGIQIENNVIFDGSCKMSEEKEVKKTLQEKASIGGASKEES